jgi:hypothetical protein
MQTFIKHINRRQIDISFHQKSINITVCRIES